MQNNFYYGEGGYKKNDGVAIEGQKYSLRKIKFINKKIYK